MKMRILVGMIASGKSEYASHHAKGNNTVIVCHDTLSAMMDGGHGRYNPGNKRFYQAAERSLATLAIDSCCDVIIDRTNLTRKSRARWVGLAKALDIEITAAVFGFDRPEVHAKRRFKHDPRGLTLSDWERIAREHAISAIGEGIKHEEGFKDIFRIDENTGPEFYGYLIRESLERPSQGR